MDSRSPTPSPSNDDPFARLVRSLEGIDEAEAQRSDSDAVVAHPTGVSPTLRFLGDYELVDFLGAGGMGKVYRAKHRSIPGKHAAVKVIHELFRFDAKRIARFQFEALAASRLSHPGIVSVITLAEQDGVQFIVQELVEGKRSLGQEIEARRKSPPDDHERWIAELFIKIAGALGALHGAKVIHRDIKPDNILLTPASEPKVADFGLARDLDAPTLTASDASPGTIEYMSPEQVNRKHGEIDARTDVYALGVTLYEALTFTRWVPEVTPLEKHRIILEEEMRDLRTVRGAIPTELSLICRKAVEKEPHRRYQSMAEFAADLRRFLNKDRILAQPPSATRRAQLWVRRHPVMSATLALGASALLVISLLLAKQIATAGMLEQANAELLRQTRRAESQEHDAKVNAAHALQNATEAERRRIEADASARRARAVTEFVQGTLCNSDPNQGGEQGYLVVDAMEDAIRELGSTQTNLDAETRANLEMTIAVILNGNARSELALDLAQRALATLRSIHVGDQVDVAQGFTIVARCLDELGRSEDALSKHEAALEMHQRLFQGDHPFVARSLNNLASCLYVLDRSEEALAKLNAALEMRQRLFQGDHPDVAGSLVNVASGLHALGRREEALATHMAALEMNQRLFQGDHPSIANCLTSVASCLHALGRDEEALLKSEAALKMSQRLFQGDHPDVAHSLSNVASCLYALGRNGEALPYFHAVLEMNQRLFRGDHPAVANSLNNVAICLGTLNRDEEALPKLKAALEMNQRLFPGDHSDVASSLNNVASCLHRLGRNEDALLEFETALEMVQRLFQADHPDVAGSLNNIAYCLHMLGRNEEALQYSERACAMAVRVLAEGHPERVLFESTLATIRTSLESRSTESAMNRDE